MTDTSPDADTRKISPAKGRRVRHENGALLEPKSTVAWSAYWQRRADDGDITIHGQAEPAEDKKD